MARLMSFPGAASAALTDRLHPNLIEIYLDDHRAGAAAGQALARRIERRYAHEPGFAELATLRRQIEEDVASLDELREELDIHGGRWKRVLAVIGVRIGGLKPNGRLVQRSPLSRVVDLEQLSAGVEGKRQLWDMLIAACGGEQLAGTDLRRLSQRADEQLGSLRIMHRRAAAAIDCLPGEEGGPAAAGSQ